MSTYLTAFNNIVFKFTDELIETFPEETDFKVYKRALTIIKSANAKKLSELFKNYSYIYREQILEKDETFFINANYNEIADLKEDYIVAIIYKLKKYWQQLSDDNKNKIWEYLITMIKLSDLLNNK